MQSNTAAKQQSQWRKIITKTKIKKWNRNTLFSAVSLFWSELYRSISDLSLFTLSYCMWEGLFSWKLLPTVGLVKQSPAWNCGLADLPQHKYIISMPSRSPSLSSLWPGRTSCSWQRARSRWEAVCCFANWVPSDICSTVRRWCADFEFTPFKCSAVFFFMKKSRAFLSHPKDNFLQLADIRLPL